MIEVHYTCVQCHRPFVRQAKTDAEIQALQQVIWKIQLCEECIFSHVDMCE